MSMLLLQAGTPMWWASGWLWFFVGCLVVLAVVLLRWTWTSPRRRR